MKPYTHFTLFERESLSEFLKEGKSFREIAKILGRSPSSISREVKRNYSYKKGRYHPWRTTVLYICRRKNCIRRSIIGSNAARDAYILECLNMYWSPEVIAHKCKERGLPISFSTIYKAIKRKQLPNITEKTHLRRRGRRKFTQGTKSNSVHPTHTIHERPAEAESKERLGDWEGDTVYGGIGKGCLVTCVDRKSKLLVAAKSESRENSNIRKAFANAFRMLELPLPIETITLDNGSEFAGFEDIENDLSTIIYFADPHSPWQRGLNENTNDLIRFFFPKGTNFLNVSDEEIASVVSLINNRPRKSLDFLSPLEFISKKCCT